MADIDFVKSGQVGVITLNRPAHRNAYTVEMSRQLSDALRECDDDEQVRCVILTGRGDFFSVGLDMSLINAHAGDSAATDAAGGTAPTGRTYPFQLRKPVIAAINGAAGGFGAAYPLTCDVRIVDRDATIGFTFVRYGLVPEMGATWLLPRLIGMERALDTLLFRTKMTGAEACQLGIASLAVSKSDVLDTALAKAARFCREVSPLAAAVTKRMTWARLDPGNDLLRSIEEDRRNLLRMIATRDCREGSSAFLENRAPNWPSSTADELSSILRAVD
jgi:enoyl-CoA hydratase/carnithine racemase